jgi:hypothetical protein
MAERVGHSVESRVTQLRSLSVFCALLYVAVVPVAAQSAAEGAIGFASEICTTDAYFFLMGTLLVIIGIGVSVLIFVTPVSAAVLKAAGSMSSRAGKMGNRASVAALSGVIILALLLAVFQVGMGAVGIQIPADCMLF